jgi:hypothetical protein
MQDDGSRSTASFLFKQDDVNAQHIMMMIDKSIKRNLRMVSTPRGRQARRLYLRTKFLWALSLVALVVLTLFEKPQWCMMDPQVADTSDCLL